MKEHDRTNVRSRDRMIEQMNGMNQPNEKDQQPDKSTRRKINKQTV